MMMMMMMKEMMGFTLSDDFRSSDRKICILQVQNKLPDPSDINTLVPVFVRYDDIDSDVIDSHPQPDDCRQTNGNDR